MHLPSEYNAMIGQKSLYSEDEVPKWYSFVGTQHALKWEFAISVQVDSKGTTQSRL